MMHKLRLAVVCGLLATALGCSSGPSYAPVSGVVTLDGKPYANAVVSFQPVGTKENPNPGRGSSAYTDENGRFVLKGDDGQNGAVVGKHLVRIMTKGNDVVGQNTEGTGSDDETPKSREVDPIPPEWNALSKNEFEVPAGGTDKANFDIKSRPKGAGKRR
jgi:hypothetical protein